MEQTPKRKFYFVLRDTKLDFLYVWLSRAREGHPDEFKPNTVRIIFFKFHQIDTLLLFQSQLQFF
jgi:hypothetical protein